MQPLTAENEPFYISILADGTIFMEETEVTLEELEASLPQLLAVGSVQRIYIRGLWSVSHTPPAGTRRPP